MNGLRIGQGYDTHRLVEGRRLILGGVGIPYAKGLFGHSDADALLHAVTDALLGALSLGDIGEHFPDTDPAYRGADSKKLLSLAYGLVRERGWRLVNLDATVFAQEPKLGPYKKQMRSVLAALLETEEERISVKAKTGEGVDAVGRGEAISAAATVLLEKKTPRRTK